MNIDNTTLYSLEEIINNVPLPVIVRKPNWTNSFTFRVERIQNGVAYGTSFRNGVEHHRLFGEYSYRLFEKFYYVSSVRYNSIEELFSAKAIAAFLEGEGLAVNKTALGGSQSPVEEVSHEG